MIPIWLALLGAPALSEPPCHDEAAISEPGQALPASPDYQRSSGSYPAPDVGLVDQDGRSARAEVVLTPGEGPLLVQFVFTTCPTVCPVLSGTFAAVQAPLLDAFPGARMVSVSIDPDHDTPGVLRDYAARQGAGDAWSLYTGDRADVDALRQAFGVYQTNKMQHQPATFLRAPGADAWVRLDGFTSADALLAEVRGLYGS